MTRTWLEVAGLVVLTQNAASQETSALLQSPDLSRQGAPLASQALPDSPLRARIVATDGRVLVTRADVTSGVAWLAMPGLAGRDSSEFRVSLVDGYLVVQDWLDRCLAATPAESRIPLAFGDCRRQPPIVEPIDGPELPVEERRFRLKSSIGYIGPTATSSLLFPRSNVEISFRLRPAAPNETRLP